MNIQIKVIPHSEQRYDTCGDWQFDAEGNLLITVSDMGNEDYQNLVAIHEYAEAMLCKKRGITDEAVTAFDTKFEEMRKQFPDIVKDDEPGWHPRAPYCQEHRVASGIEHNLAAELGVDWNEYDKAVTSL